MPYRQPAGGGFLLKAVMVGGDRRMELTRELLIGRGYGVEWIRNEEMEHWQEKICRSRLLILPYPYTVKEGHIPGWENGGEGRIFNLLERLAHGTEIIAGMGMPEEAVTFAEARGLHLAAYSEDPVFLQRNAEISGEAAVEALMQRSNAALDEMRIVLLGYGLFGRAIAVRLRALGARIWVAARRQAQRQMAVRDGMVALSPEEIGTVAPYMDAVLNTIPAVVLGKEQLRAFSKQTIFLELASPPYGIDLPAAAQLGLNVQVLPGLPTQYAPLSAARALAETIVNRFKEGQS